MKEVTAFVLGCPICQKCKHKQVPYPGLLQPLDILEHAWQHISMDFVEGLSRFEGTNTILVVVDWFTKFSYFLSIAQPFIAPHVATLLLDAVVKVHGLPLSITPDRDKMFTSNF